MVIPPISLKHSPTSGEDQSLRSVRCLRGPFSSSTRRQASRMPAGGDPRAEPYWDSLRNGSPPSQNASPRTLRCLSRFSAAAGVHASACPRAVATAHRARSRVNSSILRRTFCLSRFPVPKTYSAVGISSCLLVRPILANTAYNTNPTTIAANGGQGTFRASPSKAGAFAATMSIAPT